MDSEARKQALREQALKKTKGQRVVSASRIPKHPDNADRCYIRLAEECMKIERQLILENMPELRRLIREGNEGIRSDGKEENEENRRRARMARMARAAAQIDAWFDELERKLHGVLGLDKLRKEIEEIAEMTERLSREEWRKTVKRVLGIDLLTDYYSGDFYKDTIPKWISDNVDLITSIPSESLSAMKELVYKSYMSGRTTKDIIREIQHQYGVDKSKARLLARDQVAKLNADISEKQQKDAGSKEYTWRCVKDSRTRPCHRELDGKVFRWDKPPEMWYVKKNGSKVMTGRRCHPGQDYQCRCVALPKFDLDDLDLPT